MNQQTQDTEGGGYQAHLTKFSLDSFHQKNYMNYSAIVVSSTNSN
jgi:hypothetical protein